MGLRENLVERVWAAMLDKEGTPGGLVPVPAVIAGKFHTAHKLTREAGTLLPASRHGPRPLGLPSGLALHRDGPAGRRGRLVADAGKRNWEELTAEYGAMLIQGLGVMGARARHVNVLQHLMGYLKKDLSSEDKACLWSVGRSWASSRKPGRGCCR